jgi:hypothetical protein
LILIKERTETAKRTKSKCGEEDRNFEKHSIHWAALSKCRLNSNTIFIFMSKLTLISYVMRYYLHEDGSSISLLNGGSHPPYNTMS